MAGGGCLAGLGQPGRNCHQSGLQSGRAWQDKGMVMVGYKWLSGEPFHLKAEARMTKKQTCQKFMTDSSKTLTFGRLDFFVIWNYLTHTSVNMLIAQGINDQL